jgi:hypothetical protein
VFTNLFICFGQGYRAIAQSIPLPLFDWNWMGRFLLILTMVFLLKVHGFLKYSSLYSQLQLRLAQTTANFLQHFEDKKVLVVGDGDFSFSRALANTQCCKSLYTSTLEGRTDLLKYYEASKAHIEEIEQLGGKVLFNIDATKIDLTEQFDLIAWNFPHIAGKQNIRYNRQLLRQFLSHAATKLTSRGQIFLSLCEKQSGHDAQTKDDWNFSWKLLEQSSEAGLIMTHHEPFDWTSLPYYAPQGHRGRGGGFQTGQAEYFLFSQSSSTAVDSATLPAKQFPIYGSELHLVIPNAHTLQIYEFEEHVKELFTQIFPKNSHNPNIVSVDLIDAYRYANSTDPVLAFQIIIANPYQALSQSQANIVYQEIEKIIPVQLGLK